LGLNVTLAVVLVSLVIGFGVVGFWVMYNSKVVHASPAESAWIASQQPDSNAVIALWDDTTVVSLSRGRCFGWCPAYEVTVYGTGRVNFRGDAFVCEPSPPAVFVDPATVARLVEGLKVGGFEAMPDYLQEDATDAHTSRLTLIRGDAQHTVEHYHGDMAAPRLLEMMEDRVDEVAQTARWLPRRDGSELVCQLADGTTKPLEELAVGRDS